MGGTATKEAPTAGEEARVSPAEKVAPGMAAQQVFVGWTRNMNSRFNGNLEKLQAGDTSVISSLNDDILHANAFVRHFKDQIGPHNMREISGMLNAMSSNFVQLCRAKGIAVEMVDLSHLDKVSDHVRNIFNNVESSEHLFSQGNSVMSPELSTALEKVGIKSEDDVRKFFDRLFELRGYLRDGTFAHGAAEGTGIVSDIVPQAQLSAAAIESEVKATEGKAKGVASDIERAENYAKEARLRKELYDVKVAEGDTSTILRLAREDAERAYDRAISEYKALQESLSKQSDTEDKFRAQAAVAVAMDTLNAEKKSMQTA